MALENEVKLVGDKIIFQLSFGRDEIKRFANDIDLRENKIDMKRLYEIMATKINDFISIEDILNEYLVEQSEEK